jgi:hypothetical protein
MTPEELELARRLVAHPKWRWMGGMVAMRGDEPERAPIRLAAHGEVASVIWPEGIAGPYWFDGRIDSAGLTPDLSDPATQGCLWAMLCEASSYGRAEVRFWDHDKRPWNVWVTVPETIEGLDATRDTGANGLLYGEALARALLAAWSDS